MESIHAPSQTYRNITLACADLSLFRPLSVCPLAISPYHSSDISTLYFPSCVLLPPFSPAHSFSSRSVCVQVRYSGTCYAFGVSYDSKLCLVLVLHLSGRPLTSDAVLFTENLTSHPTRPSSLIIPLPVALCGATRCSRQLPSPSRPTTRELFIALMIVASSAPPLQLSLSPVRLMFVAVSPPPLPFSLLPSCCLACLGHVQAPLSWMGNTIVAQRLRHSNINDIVGLHILIASCHTSLAPPPQGSLGPPWLIPSSR